jgi:NitT/TauT family transport system permease protein
MTTAQDQLISAPSKATPSRPRRRRGARGAAPAEASAWVRTLQFIAVFIGVVAVWQLAVTVTHVDPVIFPKPWDVAKALWGSIAVSPSSRLSYVPHLDQTLKEVVAGYAVGCTGGLILAILSLYVRLFAIIAKPFVVAFQSMPKIALAPLVVVWFGFGFTSKFALVSIATFFPLYVNGLVGFHSVDIGLIRMMRSFDASSFQLFRKVQFLAALPFIFAGLEISVVHAVTAAVAAEFLGGQEGLGVRIIESEQTLDVPSIFAELILLALIGVLLHSIISLVRRFTVTWTSDQLLLKDQ